MSIVLYRKIIHEVGQSFTHSECTPFTVPLHYHDEYELIYIKSGEGQEFIGDSVRRYATGELTLIGGSVPHLHLCDSVTNGIGELGCCEIESYIAMSSFQRTNRKTIFECLNEIRIEHACKLLAYSNLSVSQIAYNVGFGNLSHFNNRFKEKINQTPTEYKKNLLTKIRQ